MMCMSHTVAAMDSGSDGPSGYSRPGRPCSLGIRGTRGRHRRPEAPQERAAPLAMGCPAGAPEPRRRVIRAITNAMWSPQLTRPRSVRQSCTTGAKSPGDGFESLFQRHGRVRSPDFGRLRPPRREPRRLACSLGSARYGAARATASESVVPRPSFIQMVIHPAESGGPAGAPALGRAR